MSTGYDPTSDPEKALAMPQTVEALRRKADHDERTRRAAWELDVNARLVRVEHVVDENTRLTRDSNDMLQAFLALKGGLQVLGWLGKGATWLAGFAVGGGVVYSVFYFITHGKLPPSP